MKSCFSITSLDDMQIVANEFAKNLMTGDLILLDGNLGAGKTHFVKALAAALGFNGTVSSPTFPLLHEYRWDNRVLYHLDFYRLESSEEIYQAGLDEYLPGDGIAVVEWASRFPDPLRHARWKIEIALLEDETREVTIESIDS